jgi:hypothetical protein
VQLVCAYSAALIDWSPAFETRWQYHDARGAAALIAKFGSLLALMTHIFGDSHLEPIAGDIVLSQLGEVNGAVESMGIYNGHFGLGVLPDRAGIARYNRVHISNAWTLCQHP